MSLWLHGRAAVAAAMNANSSLLDPENMTCVDIVNAFSGDERCEVIRTVSWLTCCTRTKHTHTWSPQ
jgi:hypothetical protein